MKKKYIVSGADFDEFLRKLKSGRSNVKHNAQPRKTKSDSKSKASVS
jgi:hypothetical protein